MYFLKAPIFLIFLSILTVQAYSNIAKVPVCLSSSLNEKNCINHEVNCDFSSQDDQVQLGPYLHENKYDSVEKETTSFGKHGHLVYPGDFWTTSSSSNPVYTTSLYTCSGIILFDKRCDYGSLMHYIQNGYSNTINSIVGDYKASCNPSDSTQMFILLSSVETFQQYLNKTIYRKFICGFKEEFPSSKINVFFSRKKNNESDSLYLKFDKEKVKIKFQREKSYRAIWSKKRKRKIEKERQWEF